MKSRLFLVVALVLNLGCKPALDKLDISQDDGVVYFSSEYLLKKSVSIGEIVVNRTDCEKKCVFWHVRSIGLTKSKEVNSTEGKILYGQRFENVITKVDARSLESGHFEVGGTIYYQEDGKDGYGINFAERFSLKEINGELVLVDQD